MMIDSYTYAFNATRQFKKRLEYIKSNLLLPTVIHLLIYPSTL